MTQDFVVGELEMKEAKEVVKMDLGGRPGPGCGVGWMRATCRSRRRL